MFSKRLDRTINTLQAAMNETNGRVTLLAEVNLYHYYYY